jgi:hypothetical protein
MNVIIFDKSADSDPSGVGVINVSPEVTDLNAYALEILPNGTAFEVVDDSTLPRDNPMELWIWE